MMLTHRLSAPTRMGKIASMQQLNEEAPSNPKSRHRLRTLISLAHQRQHRLQCQQRCILLLIALILLQQVELHTCRRLSQRDNRRLDLTNELASSSASSSSVADDDVVDSRNSDSSVSKRSDGDAGQPEEIFTVDDQIESNYDEYPMIVPKRAALLLDRLMVALQHALEQEDKKDQKSDPLSFDTMYGDDPTALMDYDLRDLYSINRAAGETLMGRGFQRRANVGTADGMALLKSELTSGTVAKGSGGGGGSSLNGGRVNTSRMYWRCYFNAVSCF